MLSWDLCHAAGGAGADADALQLAELQQHQYLLLQQQQQQLSQQQSAGGLRDFPASAPAQAPPAAGREQGAGKAGGRSVSFQPQPHAAAADENQRPNPHAVATPPVGSKPDTVAAALKRKAEGPPPAAVAVNPFARKKA